MKLKTYLILYLLMLSGSLSSLHAAEIFSPDTLKFRFSLYGQTRKFGFKALANANSVWLEWTMQRHGAVYRGSYVMGPESTEKGCCLCLMQPEAGREIKVPSSQTAFIISREALSSLRSTGHMTYGNTLYEMVDTISCGLGVSSLHVTDRTEGCDMWIVNNEKLPLIWQMRDNPLGIDWCVDNVAEAFCHTDTNLRVAFIADPHVQAVDSHPEFVRSLASQLKSTRLFNENIFAFRAALDDVRRRGIRLVVLPGDLTDNGQIVNIRTVKNILDYYSSRYGMKFFVTTGNHDPSKPYGEDYADGNFLAADGSCTSIASAAGAGEAGVSVDTLLHCCGYEEIMAQYAAYGFSPDKSYLYWATPFSDYDYNGYTYTRALAGSASQMRRYVLCDTLTAQDASYVVEPVEGLWLLAIDGGVYLPGAYKDGRTVYKGSSTGYANTWKHKQFLIKWIGKVADDARRHGKILIAFCHYPAADFHNGADSIISHWTVNGAFNMHRNPPYELTEALMKAGIKIHFAGHLHQNNTAVATDTKGNFMYNIQIPSVSAYMPAYKILTICGDSMCRVNTVVLDSVPQFRSIWPHYMSEYKYNRAKNSAVWNTDILYAADYPAFCDMYFRELVASRYVERELPSVVADSIVPKSGEELMRIAGADLSGNCVAAWTGLDLVTDVYRLHFAGSLALRHIPRQRISQYKAMLASLMKNDVKSDNVRNSLYSLCLLVKYFMAGEADDNFEIRLK